jgi:acetylglutamate synthase
MSYINETVNVNAFYFENSFGQLKTFPREIEHGNERLTFKDGLQYLVHQGKHAVRLFDMDDGEQTYRLRLENDIWTLVGRR